MMRKGGRERDNKTREKKKERERERETLKDDAVAGPV